MISEKLYELSQTGDLNRIKTLIEHRGANPNFSYELNQSTALHVAAKFGHAEIVRYLLENGANVDPRDKYGFTPLTLAITQQGSLRVYGVCASTNEYSREKDDAYENVIKTLLEHKADVLARDNTGNTIIHVLAGLGLLQEETLINVSESLNTIGWGFLTPLHYACGTGHESSVKHLLEASAEVDARDACGWTPFHWAAKSGNLNVCKLLVQYEADPNVFDYRGLTPLTISLIFHHMQVYQYLKELSIQSKLVKRNEEKVSECSSIILPVNEAYSKQVEASASTSLNEAINKMPSSIKSVSKDDPNLKSENISINVISLHDSFFLEKKSKIPSYSIFLCVFTVCVMFLDYVFRVIPFISNYMLKFQFLINIVISTLLPNILLIFILYFKQNFFYGPLKDLSYSLQVLTKFSPYFTLLYISYRRNSIDQIYELKDYFKDNAVKNWKYEGINAGQPTLTFKLDQIIEDTDAISIPKNVENIPQVKSVKSESIKSNHSIHPQKTPEIIEIKQSSEVIKNSKKTPWDIPYNVPYSVLDNSYMLLCEELPVKIPAPPGLVLPHLQDSATVILGIQKETSKKWLYKNTFKKPKKPNSTLTLINEDVEESSVLSYFDQEVFYWFCLVLRYQFCHLINQAWRLKLVEENSNSTTTHKISNINLSQPQDIFESSSSDSRNFETRSETPKCSSLFDSSSTLCNLSVPTYCHDGCFEGTLEDCWEYAVIHFDSYKLVVEDDNLSYLKFFDVVTNNIKYSNCRFQLFSIKDLKPSLYVVFLHMCLNSQTLATAQLLWSREFKRLTKYMNRVFSQESPKDWPLITRNRNLIEAESTDSRDFLMAIKIDYLTTTPQPLYHEILQPYIQVLKNEIYDTENSILGSHNITVKEFKSDVLSIKEPELTRIVLSEDNYKYEEKILSNGSLSHMAVSSASVQPKKYGQLQLYWILLYIGSTQFILNVIYHMFGILIFTLSDSKFSSILFNSMFFNISLIISFNNLLINIIIFFVSYKKYSDIT